MPLTELRFQPGIKREGTPLSSKGSWFNADKVRFRNGLPEKIGGWQCYVNNTAAYFLGQCRLLYNWITLSQADYLAVGTSQKFYIENGGALYDVTPLTTPDGVTVITNPVSATNPFTMTSGSPLVKITVPTALTPNVGDYIDVYNVTGGPYGGLTAAQLTGSFVVDGTTAPTATVFYVNVGVNASSSVGPVGGTVTIAAEVSPGLDVQAIGTGWGTGGWGSPSAWGYGAGGGVLASLRLWSADAFGEDLVACIVGGGVYRYHTAGGLGGGNRMVELKTLGTVSVAGDVPLFGNNVLVTPARHVVVFGTNPVGTTAQDPMYIRWSDQENFTNGTASWVATITNQAGGYRLTEGKQIIAARRTRQEILVWTDSALYSMQFSGAPYIYSFYQVGTNITTVSSNAMVTVSGMVTFWMGNTKFYMYNGAVAPLTCDVRKHVFDNIDRSQVQQVFAFTNERYNEVWWCYLSTLNLNGNNTADSYVMYNYVENTWAYGTLSRTAWTDTPYRQYPVAAANLPGYPGGRLFYHEFGNDDGTTSTPAPIIAFIESADMDILEGEKFALIQRIIPDIAFTGSTGVPNPSGNPLPGSPTPPPQCNLSIYVRRNSGAQYNGTSTAMVSEAITPYAQTTVPVDQFTQDAWIRLRGRQFKLRIDSNTIGTQWQIGVPMVRAQPDGRR